MNTVTIVLNKDTEKIIKYLVSNSGKDKLRPILTGFNVRDDKTSAIDGCKLVMLPTPDVLKEYVGKTLRPVSSIPSCKAGTPVLFEVIDGNYPNLDEIIKNQPAITSKIGFDPSLMFDLLKGMEAPVVLEISNPTSPLIIHEKDGEKWAMLMPMSIGN